jgi:hypothetical protein
MMSCSSRIVLMGACSGNCNQPRSRKRPGKDVHLRD